jgi:protein tyrosine phosphatase (PTP) superfamily phosphohydrolase (DUF442 family)
MRRIGAFFAIAAIVTSIAASSPAAAFGFRIGPFHFGIPFWHRHHHHLYMHGSSRDVARTEREPSGGRIASALLYPQLALPAMYDSIFGSAYGSSWPFGYETIFSTAFARAARGQDPHLCQPQSELADDIVGRLTATLTPTAEQQEPLQRLGGALGAASGYLAKSCPSEIPADPVARLQLMESQVEELAMALDIIRQPLQAFVRSLSDEQRARFEAMIAVPSGADIATRCGRGPASINWSINQIDRSVRPTEAQREAVTDIEQAFQKAAGDLDAHCPTAVPVTAIGRLEAIEARLDAAWRSVLSIQVALADFETKLSDDQKHRFNAMNFAAR